MRLFTLLCLLAACLLVPIGIHAATPAATEVNIRPGGNLTPDELALVLGVTVWKIDMTLPNAKKITLALQQQAKGHEPASFGPNLEMPAISTDTPRQLLIAFVPIGENLNQAEKVRVVIEAFGSTVTGVVDNPLKNMLISKPLHPDQISSEIYNLIGGYTGNTSSQPISKADVIISLNIKAE